MTGPADNASSVRYIVGDVFDVLATLEPGSVDLVLTSPPFLALRSYLPADHPDKPREIGSEPTPGAYIDRLLDVVEACDRVLAPHGSIAVELGDTYAGGSAEGTDARNEAAGIWTKYRGRSNGCDLVKAGGKWPLDKSLCLVPETFRWALVYGRNPHTGRETPRWRARNVVRWCRPNPPVGALGDKFRPATTDLVIATHARDRYFDLDAVRHINPRVDEPGAPAGKGWLERPGSAGPQCAAGAPPLDWWEIPTEPYPGAHYATWPSRLCVQPIKAMCPERVCVVCGQPSRRIVETEQHGHAPNGKAVALGRKAESPVYEFRTTTTTTTVGWTDCGHNAWRPGCVLDPFAGSGTTLATAFGHGRSAIGIDLDERNAWLARDRVGMWLDIIEYVA